MKKTIIILFFAIIFVQNMFAWGGAFRDVAKQPSATPTFYLGDVATFAWGISSGVTLVKIGVGILASPPAAYTNLTWNTPTDYTYTGYSGKKSDYTVTSVGTGYYSIWLGYNKTTVGTNGSFFNGKNTTMIYGDGNNSSGTSTVPWNSTYCYGTFTVSAINNPTVTTPFTTTSSSVSLAWSKNTQSHNVMIVRKLSSATWTEPTQGTAYAIGASIGSGTVIYNSNGTSYSNTELLSSTAYDYKFYSVNNNYYSSGVVASTKTSTAATDYFRSKTTGNWNSTDTWESSSNNTNWVQSTLVPSSSPTTVTILDGHIVSIDENVTVNSLILNSGSTLTINAAKQLTVTGALTNNGTLNLLSSVDGTATLLTNGTVSGTGTANVNQYLSSARNWYMSSPVTSTVLPATTTGSLTLYSYPEADVNQTTSGTSPIAWTPGNYWVTPTETSFIVGKGYIVAPSATATVTFAGTLNTGTVSSGTLTRTPGNPKTGFNLVGNPYPSAVNVRTVINNTAALEKSIWYRTRNASNKYVFETYNTTTGIGTLNDVADGKITGTVPPMQSFWVRVAAENTSASFNFENSMRSHLTANPDTLNAFKVKAMEAENKILRLSIANEVVKDEAIIYFNANASDSYDVYDSEKWLNNGTTVPNLYTTVGTEQLVINGMNAIPYDVEIPLTVQANAGTYTLSASEFSNFAADENVQLIDKKEGTTDLIKGNHVFSITNGENTVGRLSIIFRSPGSTTGVDTNANNAIAVYSIRNSINVTVNSELNENASVSVFNAVGQQLVNQYLTNRSTTVNGNFNPGVYVVKVSNGTAATATQKIVIK